MPKDRPLNPSQRFVGSNPGTGFLGVAQPDQSAAFGTRRASVQVRPPRPRGLGQQPSRLLRKEEDAGASPASPTVSPRSSNGRAPVLRTGDGGSIPSRGTARYASGEAPLLASGRGSVRFRHAPPFWPHQLDGSSARLRTGRSRVGILHGAPFALVAWTPLSASNRDDRVRILAGARSRGPMDKAALSEGADRGSIPGGITSAATNPSPRTGLVV
jgi:hypothetical protein